MITLTAVTVTDVSLAEYIVGHVGGIEVSSSTQCRQVNTGTLTGALAASLLANAVASDTLSNSNNTLTWNWSQTSNNQAGLTIGEAAPATGGSFPNQFGLKVSGASGSTAIPLGVIGSLGTSQTLPTLYIAPTWNTGTGVVDAGILENVNDTGSGAGSLLIDLQVGGSSKMSVDKTGSVAGARYSVSKSSVLVSGDFGLTNWGSGASVSITDTTSRDQAFFITVTTGTTPSSNPVLTLNFHNGTWGNVPVYICKKESGPASISAVTEQASATQLTITFAGLPLLSQAFAISCIGFGT